jgi:5-methylcytosine-specific restriction endonuclease McrA
MGLEARVLVLNASYEAINVCNLKRALKMVLKGTAQTEEASDWHEVCSPSLRMRRPLVIRLVSYVHIPHLAIKFSRKNVFVRDRYTCQYCGEKPARPLLTIDHVVPRSRNGATRWENVVAACRSCNNKKGDQTPHEAKMITQRKPKAPTIISHLQPNHQSYDPSWKKYLYL